MIVFSTLPNAGQTMVNHLLSTARRTLLRHRLFAVINICGLAVGLAVAILILLFVRNELSFDVWINDAERIGKLEMTINSPGRNPIALAVVPPLVVQNIKQYFPDEIEAASSVFRQFETTVRSSDQQFGELINWVDPEFFEIFNIPSVAGSLEAGLANNTSILLSERMARKYFGDGPALGQILNIDIRDQNVDFQVVGVFAEVPANSHLEMDFIALLDNSRDPRFPTDWSSGRVHGYVKFVSVAAMNSVAERLKEYYHNKANVTGPEDPSSYNTFNLLPVLDVYLHSDKMQNIKAPGNYAEIIGFLLIAILILLIAGINYMNLATAGALTRIREMSIRKISGATGWQLFWQLLGETLLITVIGGLVALLLVELALPYFNALTGRTISLELLAQPVQAIVMIVIATLVGLVGGLYPAILLARYRPAAVLGSGRGSGHVTTRLRSFLVVFQFAVSIGLMVSTFIVYQQTDFALKRELGFSVEHKVVLSGLSATETTGQAQTIKSEIDKLPGVVSVAMSSDQLPLFFYNNMELRPGGSSNTTPISTSIIFVDADYLSLLNIQLLAGRLYSSAYQADVLNLPVDENLPITRSIIVTESYAKKAGRTAAAMIGDEITVENYSAARPLHARVVGVVADAQLRSAREAIAPVAFFVSASVLDTLTVSVLDEQLPATLEQIENIWKQFSPRVPMQMSFMDENFAKLYTGEVGRGRMFAGFALFAIFVACLGLYGLAAFAAEQKIQEFGLRKVLGASRIDLLRLIGRQFLTPVIVANLVAWPVAWFLANQWLDSFAFRIDQSFWPYVAAAVVSLLLAGSTVGVQAIRVARTRPVDSLRHV